MKKIGKKLNKFMKLFLAFGLLFNNLSSLSIVFADEIPGEETEVKETFDNETTLEDPKKVTDTETEPTETPEAVEFSVNLEDNQIVIKYTGTLDLEEKIVVSEDFTYVDGSKHETVNNEILLTDDVKEALAGEEGYVVDSTILVDNLFEGAYNAKVTIGEEEKKVDKTIEANGEGIEFKLYTSDETEVEPFEDEEIPRYYIDKGNDSFIVTARLLNGGISPKDVITVDGEEIKASELFEEGTVAEEVLEGYLYGEFDFNVSFDYTINGQEETASKTFTIMYGAYEYISRDLNESAKKVGLESKYYFYGNHEENAFYVVGEEGLEDILKDYVGDSEIITYEIVGNKITLTDGRVTVTYEEAELNEYGKIAARLESDSNEVSSGDTVTVKYIVNIDDYYINGVSGLVKYDETLLKLVSIETDESIAKYEFEGGNENGRFLYAGYRTLLSELEVDDEGNATEIPKDYVILTLTFEALKAGEADISIEDARFYDSYFYFESEEDINTNVIINEATDNSLSSLTVSGQSIELQEGQLGYEITVGNDITDSSVEALVANTAAAITKIDAPESLVEGENTITIEVTAENGDIKVYTVKVTREAVKEEETTNEVITPVTYQEEYNTDNREPEVIVTPGDKDQEKDAASEEENDKNNVSRIIIIILILLAIAGLIYLIFKDDDDEETKKANKEIDRLKKEDNKKVDNKRLDNKKVKKKER